MALVLLITGFITLVVIAAQAFVLIDAKRAEQEGVKDNLIWVVGQIVIEAQAVEIQLLKAIAAGEPVSPQHELGIRQSIEILIGRTRVASAAYTSWMTKDMPTPGLEAIRAQAYKILDTIERAERLGLDDLRLIESDLRKLCDLAIDTANRKLHSVMSVSESRRKERMAQMQQGMLALWVLAGLLILMVAQGIRATLMFARESRKTLAAAQRLQRTFDASPDAVCALGPDLTILSNNDRCDAFAVVPGTPSFRKATLLDYVLPEDREGIIEALSADLGRPDQQDLLNLPTVWRFRVRMNASAGTPIPVEILLARMNKDDDSSEFVCFVRDRSVDVATERGLRAARDRAIQDAGIKERFLALIGHELRTPLQGVLAAIELLDSGEGKLGAPQLRQSARHCAQSALGQIDSLLALARDGRISDTQAPFSPKAVVVRITEELTALAAENSDMVAVELIGNQPEAVVLGSQLSFDLALRNLLTNAIKYTRKGTVTARLAIHVTQDMADVTVSVLDTGVGISPEALPRLFDEFNRVNECSDLAPSGFGLGLAIAKASVERLGGKIEVQSELGKGSLFEFSFRAPVTTLSPKAPPKRPRPQNPETNPTKPLRILLVEDDKVNQTLLVAMLSRMGHEAIAASDGIEALKLAREGRFDHIFMDLGLPGSDGIETAMILRQAGVSAETPITILTARDPEGVQFDAAKAMISDVIRKPVDMKRLQLALEQPGAAFRPMDAGPILSPDIASAIDLVGMPTMQDLIHAVAEDSEAAIHALEGWNGSKATATDVVAIVHKAHGSAGVLGALRLAEGWHQIESRLRRGVDVRKDAADVMRDILTQTRKELGALTDPAG